MMYISCITYKDTSILLDRSDYDLVGSLLLESAIRVVNRLDSVYETKSRDIELESYDLLPERFVSFIKLKYRYSNVSVFYCSGWGNDDVQ